MHFICKWMCVHLCMLHVCRYPSALVCYWVYCICVYVTHIICMCHRCVNTACKDLIMFNEVTGGRLHLGGPMGMRPGAQKERP